MTVYRPVQLGVCFLTIAVTLIVAYRLYYGKLDVGHPVERARSARQKSQHVRAGIFPYGNTQNGMQPTHLPENFVAVSHPERIGNLDPPGLNIRLGTFVYMVMGAELPPQRWTDRRQWVTVSILYTSWKQDVSGDLKEKTGPDFRVSYFPNSTWTTGRNHQLKLARSWEEEQQWKFEFFIFFDEDARLAFHGRIAPTADSDDDRLRHLNDHLLRDRPLFATVRYHHDRADMVCVTRCHADHIILAVHRSGLDLLLPYRAILDAESWWYSAAIFNYFAAAIFPSYCTEYQDILVDHRNGSRKKYPHGGPRKNRWTSPLKFVANCLANASFPGYRRGMSRREIENKVYGAQLSGCRAPVRAGHANYYKQARQSGWLHYLNCVEREIPSMASMPGTWHG